MSSANDRSSSDEAKKKWLLQLCRACDQNNLTQVQAIVNSCEEGTFCGIVMLRRLSTSPLHVACAHGYTAIVTYLLESDRIKVDVNLRDDSGRTALHRACHHGKTNIVKYLMELARAHVDINIRDNHSNTPMQSACYHGHKDIVEYFMRSDRNNVDINPRNTKGETPPHWACRRVSSDLRYQMESNDVGAAINSNVRNNNGDTLLHLACRMICSDAEDMIAYLVQCDKIDTDSHIRTQNNDGDTPFHLLCSHRHRGMLSSLKLLIEVGLPNNNNNNNNNGDNSNKDNMNIDEILKIQNSDGNTPLHVACKHQKEDVIEYLLQSLKTNSSHNIQNRDGDTPFHIAFNRDLFVVLNDITRLTRLFDFIQHQVIPAANLTDLSQPDNSVGSPVIIKRLIEEARPIANIQNHEGNTLLHLACASWKSSTIVLRVLVGCDSVDATLVNSDGDTALHCIPSTDSDYYKYRLRKMKILIQLSDVKVDVNTRNNYRETVLHCAVEKNCLGLVEYLMTLDDIDIHSDFSPR